MSKFTKIFDRSILIQPSKLSFISSISKSNKLTFYSYLCLKYIFFIIATQRSTLGNSLISGGISHTFSFIVRILSWSTYTQIFSSIVQSIMVNVVNYLSFFGIHNYTSHFYYNRLLVFPAMSIARSIKTLTMFIKTSAPLPLLKKFIVFVVNKRKLSLCQFNSFHYSIS